MARRFTFRGRPYTWYYVRRMPKGYGSSVGLLSRDTSTIRISSKIDGELRLDTEIHEMLHACLPDIDEEAVNETATDLARTLWAMGYRLSPKPP